MTKTDAILKKFQHLNVWRRGDERAPHKPLLILYALGRLQAGADRLIPFDELEKPLARLLEDFGPPRKSVHPELPFFHLQTDGVWEIHDNVGLTVRKGSRNPLRSELRKWRIAGGFDPAVYQALKDRPEAVRELARAILAAHFPDSLCDSIVQAVGLDLDGIARSTRRDAAFRDSVVSVWAHQCAFCGFSVQLDSSDLALEAAHIRWVQFGGPDAVNNGLAFRFRFCHTRPQMPVEWRYRGRTVTSSDIVFIRDLIAQYPQLSRRKLSARLCEAWQWKQGELSARLRKADRS